MATVKDALSEISAHERECSLRYRYIEKRLDEGSEKFKRLEIFKQMIKSIRIKSGFTLQEL